MSDVPTDLIIHVNNTKYLLHKVHSQLCVCMSYACPDMQIDLYVMVNSTCLQAPISAKLLISGHFNCSFRSY